VVYAGSVSKKFMTVDAGVRLNVVEPQKGAYNYLQRESYLDFKQKHVKLA